MAAVVLNGSFLIAAPIAVLAGLVSFVSPCVLPLVPGYVGYVSGLAGAQLQKEMAGDQEKEKKWWKNRMLWGAVLFVAGFSGVFVSLGWMMGSVAALSAINMGIISQASGVVVILMSIVFMGGFRWFQQDVKISYKPRRGLWGASVLGMVFAVGWSPCMGPVLTAVYTLSLSGGADGVKGAGLLAAYCLGLGLPFILVSLSLHRGVETLSFLRRRRITLMRFGGALLFAVGALMVTGVWNVWINSVQIWLDNVYLPV